MTPLRRKHWQFPRIVRELMICWLVLVTFSPSVSICSPAPPDSSITIRVDASDAPRGIFHSDLRIPTRPGPLKLLYPKWIPGEHSPSGPILQLVGLTITGAGQPIPWKRDLRDMYAFHCTIPPAASTINVSLDYLSPTKIFDTGYGNSPNSTAHLLTLPWNHVLLYPEKHKTDSLTYQARLRLPEGWRYATALPVQTESGNEIEFAPVSLTTLVDAPVIAGEFFRSIALSPQNPSPVQLDIVADDPGWLQIDTLLISHYRNLQLETDALFGSRHYQQYRFLVSLSDALLLNGLEHHECTDIRLPAMSLSSPSSIVRRSYLLVHEFIHSWNGKYRRPAGLATPNYNEPMEDDMLWVYEGLTKYLDLVLTARTGVRTREATREYLAWLGALQDQDRPGRTWRSLYDAQVAAQLLYAGPEEWTGYRLDADYFYYEGLLIWLDVDGIIREKSQSRYSLDDFCQIFFGGSGDPPTVKPYTFDDLVHALNDLVSFDWSGFFTERLTNTSPHAHLQGIRRSGWNVVYSENKNGFMEAKQDFEGRIDECLTLGLLTDMNGIIIDAVPGTAGFKAGLGPGMRIAAVNGKTWTQDLLRDALVDSRSASAQMDMIVEHGGHLTHHQIEYHQGPKYPHLERNNSQPDRLTQILNPRATH